VLADKADVSNLQVGDQSVALNAAICGAKQVNNKQGALVERPLALV